jgi:transposase-like protein
MEPRRHDIRHLDEAVISIGGRKHRLRCVVDQDGNRRIALQQQSR